MISADGCFSWHFSPLQFPKEHPSFDAFYTVFTDIQKTEKKIASSQNYYVA